MKHDIHFKLGFVTLELLQDYIFTIQKYLRLNSWIHNIRRKPNNHVDHHGIAIV